MLVSCSGYQNGFRDGVNALLSGPANKKIDLPIEMEEMKDTDWCRKISRFCREGPIQNSYSNSFNPHNPNAVQKNPLAFAPPPYYHSHVPYPPPPGPSYENWSSHYPNEQYDYQYSNNSNSNDSFSDKNGSQSTYELVPKDQESFPPKFDDLPKINWNIIKDFQSMPSNNNVDEDFTMTNRRVASPCSKSYSDTSEEEKYRSSSFATPSSPWISQDNEHALRNRSPIGRSDSPSENTSNPGSPAPYSGYFSTSDTTNINERNQ